MTSTLKFLLDWQENKPHFHSLRYLAICVPLAAIYLLAGKLGLRLAFLHASATPVWAPTGIALAAFLLLGYRVWPPILIGAFLVNVTTLGTVATSMGIAIGNTAEGLLGAYLVNRFAGGLGFFHRAQDLFRFAVLAGMLSTTVSATLGVTSLALGGFADWTDYTPIWLTWWLGDAVGDILFAPLLLLCLVGPSPQWNQRKLFEAMALGLSLFLAGWLVFGGLLSVDIKNYPLEFLCIPFLIWIAFRFGELEAAMGVLLLSGIAIWGTLHGYGPFVRESRNESLLLLQAFLGVVGVMTISVAAIVTELRTTREELQRKVVTDPVTGLANYRRFEEAFNAEVERSRRNGRPFALLLLDLDGLKKINDTYGHLFGNQALRRVAIVLQFHSRAVDTAARYGGDEFAVLLPETEAERACRVAERIAERVADDGEEPLLSISFGISVYPQGGDTIEEIFRTADAALYAMKRAGGSKVSI